MLISRRVLVKVKERRDWRDSESFTPEGGHQQTAPAADGVYNATAVTVTNASYDGTVPAGASIEIGFDGTYSGNALRP